jgi:hypothetical protein
MLLLEAFWADPVVGPGLQRNYTLAYLTPVARSTVRRAAGPVDSLDSPGPDCQPGLPALTGGLHFSDTYPSNPARKDRADRWLGPDAWVGRATGALWPEWLGWGGGAGGLM